MGGLLSRMQVTNSGRTIWNEVFGPRAQELYSDVPNDFSRQASPDLSGKPSGQASYLYRHTAPGEQSGRGGIGAIANRLIRIPFDLLHKVPETLVKALNPESQRGILPTSIQGLSPKSPLLHALDRLPIEAPHHSIIGDRGRGDTPNSSDGVVPYWSSHLASAQSEKIVPSGHEAMTDPQAVEEIHRILLLNLGIGENRASAASVK
jgi:hypothetical protein